MLTMKGKEGKGTYGNLHQGELRRLPEVLSICNRLQTIYSLRLEQGIVQETFNFVGGFVLRK